MKFQYISCYSLSQLQREIDRLAMRFQYISCYSLSERDQLDRLIKDGFNTSHVILYLRKGDAKAGEVAFQYISCYSLSPFFEGRKTRLGLFQYISCYSLSISDRTPNRPLMRFNTSHVILYPGLHLSELMKSTSFNTSHVILYPNFKLTHCFPPYSFNTSHVILYPATTGKDRHRSDSFNTSHVILYRVLDNCELKHSSMFQYISCYSLSIRAETYPHGMNCFNTSHVILYHSGCI